MRPFPTRIYLTGFMAVGKTTVGRRLAKRLAYRFIDLDQEIEHQVGAQITEIFATDGEEHFRSVEAAVLKQTLEIRNVVVALGGGALLRDENRLQASSAGVVVYLHVDKGALLDRLMRNRSQRPLAARAGSDEARAREHLEQIYEQRLPLYRNADVTVNVTGLRRSAATLAVEKAITDALRQ